MPDSDGLAPVAAHHKTPADAFPMSAISGANPNRSSHDPTFLPFRGVVTSETPPSVDVGGRRSFDDEGRACAFRHDAGDGGLRGKICRMRRVRRCRPQRCSVGHRTSLSRWQGKELGRIHLWVRVQGWFWLEQAGVVAVNVFDIEVTHQGLAHGHRGCVEKGEDPRPSRADLYLRDMPITMGFVAWM